MRDIDRFASAMALLVSGAIMLSGCAGPTKSEAYERARSAVEGARADQGVQKYASVELNRAEDALRQASAAREAREDEETVDHLSYLAEQRAAIAQATAEAGKNRAEIKALGGQRPEILLQAEKQKAAALQQKLADLQAKQTERSLVLTLGDILFNVGGSDLKAGAQQQLMRVADYLKENPDRTVLVEGHTDNTGSEAYNLALSERRANAVRQALVVDGVDPSRITARGLGESYPVATNATASGRQQNRRVDVIIQ